MNPWKMLIREIRHNPRGILANIIAVAVAVAVVGGALTVLKTHELHTANLFGEQQKQTEEKLHRLWDEMRKATLQLKFNLLILPEKQSLRQWHIQDSGNEYMPEEYITKLANGGLITARHFLATLQERLKWPETGRTIILIGTKGETPSANKSPRTPMVDPVPQGRIVLGHELWYSLDIQTNQTLTLLGRDFKVQKCHPERGTKDDISVWIHLDEAQELLDKPAQINAIQALECLCSGGGILPALRPKIKKLLPETQVIERKSKALARAEARLKTARESKQIIATEKKARQKLLATRTKMAGVVVPSVIIAAVIWIMMLELGNIRKREPEIGILRAIGLGSRHILALFLGKQLLAGLIGGVIGFILGGLGGRAVALALGETELLSFNGTLMLICVAIAIAIGFIGGWIPTLLAIRRDPAKILNKK